MWEEVWVWWKQEKSGPAGGSPREPPQLRGPEETGVSPKAVARGNQHPWGEARGQSASPDNSGKRGAPITGLLSPGFRENPRGRGT